MDHSAGFLKVVNEARPRVNEITVEEAKERLAKNPRAVLMDVREDDEWRQQHAAQAMHLGKGILERDLENKVPDTATEILMYLRRRLSFGAHGVAAQHMGYKNVFSVMGGYKALVKAGWPMKAG